MKQNRPNKKDATGKIKSPVGRTVRQPRSRGSVDRNSKSRAGLLSEAHAIENVQYVLPLGNGWVVKGSKATSFTAITDSKTEAISIARTLARTKHSEMIVHGRNGIIEMQENYVV